MQSLSGWSSGMKSLNVELGTVSGGASVVGGAPATAIAV
jgi:hypothetical protein